MEEGNIPGESTRRAERSGDDKRDVIKNQTAKCTAAVAAATGDDGGVGTCTWDRPNVRPLPRIPLSVPWYNDNGQKNREQLRRGTSAPSADLCGPLDLKSKFARRLVSPLIGETEGKTGSREHNT